MNQEIPSRVDLSFRLTGKLAPLDHGYALFGALCRVLGDLHNAAWLSVHPLAGLRRPDGLLAVDARRGLRLRLDPTQVPRVIPLAGKELDLDGHVLRIGVPSIAALQPASPLVARKVVIKGFTEPEPFRDAVRRQLDAMAVTARVEIDRRRVLRIAGDTVVGFGVTLHEISDDDSIRVQSAGIGGRQRMGCGVFVPVRRRPS